jgi:hypothetical protein
VLEKVETPSKAEVVSLSEPGLIGGRFKADYAKPFDCDQKRPQNR